jgi:hypothetical protein
MKYEPAHTLPNPRLLLMVHQFQERRSQTVMKLELGREAHVTCRRWSDRNPTYPRIVGEKADLAGPGKRDEFQC